LRLRQDAQDVRIAAIEQQLAEQTTDAHHEVENEKNDANDEEAWRSDDAGGIALGDRLQRAKGKRR
jgi:hypothetical protein